MSGQLMNFDYEAGGYLKVNYSEKLVTLVKDARVLGERVRLVVEENVVEAEGFRDGVTISIGVASFDQGFVGISEMMKAADDAVYQAKTLGRNQVRSAREDSREADELVARRKSA